MLAACLFLISLLKITTYKVISLRIKLKTILRFMIHSESVWKFNGGTKTLESWIMQAVDTHSYRPDHQELQNWNCIQPDS